MYGLLVHGISKEHALSMQVYSEITKTISLLVFIEITKDNFTFSF